MRVESPGRLFPFAFTTLIPVICKQSELMAMAGSNYIEAPTVKGSTVSLKTQRPKPVPDKATPAISGNVTATNFFFIILHPFL